MADNRQVLIHLHTGEVKAPTSGVIELGEIAVQHNDNEAALYVKKTNGEISKFIDETGVNAKIDAKVAVEKARAEGIESGLSDKIDALEGSNHTHSNKGVLDGVTAEKVAAWDGAVSKEHTHDNKALLDSYTQTEENLADAVAKKHEHTNKTVLDGVTTEKVTAWDAAEQNAKNYADGLASNYDAAGAASTAEKNAKDYADSLAGNYEVAGAEGRASAYTNAEIAKLSGVYATKNTVDTLVGSDTDKSVRTVAAEEVAKVVAEAPESYNTLKEIADWIQNDTTGSAEMANDIKDLQDINADSRLNALEAISGESHTHSNKALLDTYTQTEVDLADAVAKKHEHTNKAVLDGVTTGKVAAWDAAEQNAKNYADSLASNYDAAGAAAGVKSWVEEQNYLKTHQDISGLATKTEVTEAEGRASAYTDTEIAKLGEVYDAKGAAAGVQSWVEAQNYLTEHQDISTLATKTEVAEAEGRASAYTDTKISTLRIDCGTF